MKRLIFLRHGKTNYTGIFPDLSDVGKKEAECAAKTIIRLIGKVGSVNIVCSPLPRAHGTATIIAEMMGKDRDSVKLKTELRGMEFYNKERGLDIWKRFSVQREMDYAYANDPIFEEGEYLEKRSDIQRRFMFYLSSLFEEYANRDRNMSDTVIHVAHYEILWGMVQSFCDGNEPLVHCELIVMELNYVRDGKVSCRLTFRDKERLFDAELPSVTIARQLGLNIFG